MIQNKNLIKVEKINEASAEKEKPLNSKDQLRLSSDATFLTADKGLYTYQNSQQYSKL